MSIFRNWVPGEIFLYLVVPLCAMVLIIFFGPQCTDMIERDRDERLFKECVEESSANDCRFILKAKDSP